MTADDRAPLALAPLRRPRAVLEILAAMACLGGLLRKGPGLDPTSLASPSASIGLPPEIAFGGLVVLAGGAFLGAGAMAASALMGWLDGPHGSSRFRALSSRGRDALQSREHPPHCPVCCGEFTAPKAPILICRLCQAPHHGDCARWNGACGIYGCTGRR